MKFNSSEIIDIAGPTFVCSNIKAPKYYDWIDIVGIPPRPDGNFSNLYFTTYSKGEGGWDNGFDRRPIAAGVSRDKGWDLCVEEGVETNGADYIKVSNLSELATRLYLAARSESNPYVVGITGSVGKTTIAGFLEHMAVVAGLEVVRFYSKRLTPLSVICHYVNRVGVCPCIVIMEYSAYLFHHVGDLANLLPPNLAFLSNIYETHINPGMFTDKQSIYESKIRIAQKGTRAYLNARILRELGVPCPEGWESFEVTVPDFNQNMLLPPTLRTAELYTIGILFARNLGLDDRVVDEAFSTFIPVERRIALVNFKGKPLYFHGETSGGSRLYSWFETFDGNPPNFFVEEINFADEDPNGFKVLLETVFSSPKTFVLDTSANRTRLPVRANFVSQQEFAELLNKSKGYTVYHKAMAARQPYFDPQNYINDVWG